MDAFMQRRIKAVSVACKTVPAMMADRHRLHCGFVKERSSEDGSYILQKGANQNDDKETTAMVKQFLDLIGNERFGEFANMKSDDNTGKEARLGDRDNELKAIMVCMGALLVNPHQEKDMSPLKTHHNAQEKDAPPPQNLHNTPSSGDGVLSPHSFALPPPPPPPSV
jgi:hypothetical protein